MQRSKVILVVQNARLSGVLTGQQRRSRRIAQWILRISSIESDTLSCKPVEIWSFYNRVAVGTECWAEIVGCNEQDVVLGFLSSRNNSSSFKVRRPRDNSDDNDECDDSKKAHG